VARFSLIPREESFYSDFITMADLVRAGAKLLEEMFSTDPPRYEKAQEIKEIEHKCDFLTHEVIQRLNQTFITPLDREDIHLLAHSIDDVLDAIDDAAVLIPLYRIEKVRFGPRELTNLIARQTEALRGAVEALPKRKGVLEQNVEVKRLEHEADQIHLKAVSQLYDEERDPITLIKWKEILDYLEKATDRCDDVANLLDNVVVKHG
jgi:predicted phosphate transport protein (TIGR00153 family)